jgi:uncharacterized glyoxalase superfamily protein PhnB
MSTETNVIIRPVLHYSDLEKAIRFFRDAFGFDEQSVARDPSGAIQYAEMELGGCSIGFGPTTGSIFDMGPSAVYVGLDDPDAHYERAKAAGAEIVMPLTDQEYGSRDYAARDPEGNVWCFGTFRPGS